MMSVLPDQCATKENYVSNFPKVKEELLSSLSSILSRLVSCLAAKDDGIYGWDMARELRLDSSHCVMGCTIKSIAGWVQTWGYHQLQAKGGTSGLRALMWMFLFQNIPSFNKRCISSATNMSLFQQWRRHEPQEDCLRSLKAFFL